MSVSARPGPKQTQRVGEDRVFERAVERSGYDAEMER